MLQHIIFHQIQVFFYINLKFNIIKYKTCFDYTNVTFKKFALNEQTFFHWYKKFTKKKQS